MVVLGLVLIVLGAVVILLTLFTASIEVADEGERLDHVTVLGFNTTPEVLFLLGVGAATAVFLGIWLMVRGAKSGWRRRREQRRIDELSTQLEEAERRRDADEDER